LTFDPQTGERSEMKRWVSAVLALLASTVAARAADYAGRELVVFGAASLREAFGAIADRFDRRRPGARVVFNFAGSQELVAQIANGASADVVASADPASMAKVARLGLIERPRPFARNEPVLAVAPDSRASIRSFEDLPRAARIVLGGAEVPIGRYTREILDRASERYGPNFRRSVEERVVSNELNVRQVLAKVRLGEADAGIVYRTDVTSVGGDVAIVEIPAEVNVTAEYSIAVLKSAPHRALAEAWVEAVTGPDGQVHLAAAGFLPGGERASRGESR
jgi:molybdate transport system substrate-binding protein